MRSSQTILVLETLRNSFSAPLRRKGIELSFDDTQTVLDVYQQWLALMVDLGYLHLDQLLRQATRLLTDMVEVDVLDLNNSFTECLHLVRVQNFKGFKGLCQKISSHLYAMLKDDMKLVCLGDVRAAKRLMQVFAYTSRLSLNDIDLTQQMLEDYRNVEANMVDINTVPAPLIRRLNNVIKRWMSSFGTEQFIYHHGKRGVAGLGRASYEAKYLDLRTDQMLEYAFGTPYWLDGQVRPLLDRTSKTIFVPKSYKTFRTISMEPATLMYFQQGILDEIDRLVRHDRYLWNHIGTRDQSRNRELAKLGSITRKYATIDLSAASDSVSYDLVKALFRGTKLLRYVIATRSRETALPDGSRLTLKKFAPMGSALCFPVETLIFAAVCEIVTEGLRVAGDYSVYGDDIIVPTQCVESAIRILTTLGFRINREKSFYRSDCWFRESCGGEYCDGYDVTPLRVSRKYMSRERDVRLSKWISTANDAYIRGFRVLRQFYLKKIRDSGHIPLFSPTSLLADNYTNYHTKRRWNNKLQRIEVKTSGFVDRFFKKDVMSQDEDIRYRHWLESTQQRKRVDMGFQSIICKPTKVFQITWAAKPYEVFDQDFIDKSRKLRKNCPSS